MNFGTDTDKINMEIGSVNIKELVKCFHFQVMPLERIQFHNVNIMLLTFVATLYLMHCSYYAVRTEVINKFC